MKTKELELIPGVPGTPLYTPEEYEAFRIWWRENVVPLIEEPPHSLRLV